MKMLAVSDGNLQDIDFFEAVKDQMQNGGYEAMLYDLLRVEYPLKELRRAPKTKALLDQILNTSNVARKFWIDRLRDGTLSQRDGEWTGAISAADLHGDYLEFANKLKAGYLLDPQAFGKEIRKICKDVTTGKPTIDGKRSTMYYFPPLDRCRLLYEKLVGMEGQVDWGDGTI